MYIGIGFGSGYRKFCAPWWEHFFSPSSYYKPVKWFLQRGWRGYADSDVWSLDWYLRKFMPQALGDLKSGPGYPSGLTEEKWNKILDDIAAGFLAAHALADYDYETNTQRENLEKIQKKGLKLFVKYFNSLWN
jgi:hypothetical protein